MTNKGADPIVPTSDVGQVRLNVGDTNGKPLDPAEDGYLDYEYMSDAEIEALLESADGSVIRATGYAFRKIATYLTMIARDITTDDLRIRTVERAKELRAIANDWIADADSTDAVADSAIFEIIPFAGRDRDYVRPEGTPWALLP